MPQYYDPDSGKPIANPQMQGAGNQYYDPDTGKPVMTPDGKGIVLPPAAAPTGELRAASTGVVPWFNDLENDLRHGGGRTVVGRAMGHLQGQGDKGYTGLEAGVSPGQADYMGSIPLGMAKAGKGAAEIGTGSPWKGTKDVVGGTLQMATIPSAFAVGPEGEAAVGAASNGVEKLWNKVPSIPTRAKAGKLFDTVMSKSADLPVETTQSSEPLTRAFEMGERGMTRPKVVNQLFRRLTTPDAEPMNYREARDFAQSLSRQSSSEGQKLTPAMKAQVGKLSHAFNEDVGQTAQGAGVGNEYQGAMDQYRQAMQLRKALISTAKVGGGALATGYLAHRLIPSVLPER